MDPVGSGIAFLFAGQGSQRPGMGADIASRERPAADVFRLADEVRPGTSRQCWQGTAEELGRTENTQPCVFACDLAVARALEASGVRPAAVAGHSLGELAALVFAGGLADARGMSLVCERARLMAGCARRHPGAMRAVLRLDAATVADLAAQAGDECWPVNLNSPTQTVVAGSVEACARLDALVREAHGRSVALAVSGAFHSPYMADASSGLARALAGEGPREPRVPVWANLTARPYGGGPREMAATLADQASHPVRWVETLRGMRDSGIGTFVEVGPGHALTGLVRQTLEGATALSVETEEQLRNVVKTLVEEGE